MSPSESELSSPMISVSVKSSPPPSTVLSITFTPFVCVVLTRQGINGVLLMCAFYSAPSEQRAPAVCRPPCPWRPLGITLFTDIEDASTSSLWVQSVIKLFMLLKCSKNTSVHVRKKKSPLLFYFSAEPRCEILTESWLTEIVVEKMTWPVKEQASCPLTPAKMQLSI